MFGLLSAGVSLAGLGMSAIQAIKANKTIKQEQAKSDAILNQAGSMTRQNQLAGVKSADVSSLDYQQNQQLMSQGVDTLGGLGAEGAAGVAGLFEAGRQANLQAAQAQGMADYNQRMAIAGEQSAIDKENLARQESILGYRVGQANQNIQNAYDTKNQAIQGMFSLGASALGYAGKELSPYFNSGNRNPAPGTNAGNTTPMTQEQYIAQQNQNTGMNLLGIR